MGIIKAVTPEELKAVLEAHGKWLRGESGEGSARANLDGANLDGANLARANLARANLARANLDGAYLAGANLDGAYLAGANLDGAYLAGAKISDTTRLPEGVSFAEFRDSVVPALLAAGGRMPTSKCWDCHSWDNCPMAEAFGVHRLSDIPPQWRPWAARFVQFFDAKLLPQPACLLPHETPKAAKKPRAKKGGAK
jgi:hypothetical protein